jgi:hypothetical protein
MFLRPLKLLVSTFRNGHGKLLGFRLNLILGASMNVVEQIKLGMKHDYNQKHLCTYH